ncbi:MAG: Gfo/Idh/MocA family oxidoreductase [Planctomycetaceae bacterium]|jgi:predicted dehydrogenase|nr:Gfo/Idh/MocA family oxidoreductase [Planctomycetaceae bacterium]
MYGILINGAGWVARQHIRAYLQRSDCRIVAVNNRSEEHAVNLVKEFGLENTAIYTDFQQALQHPEIDIVSICTPQHRHCEHVLQAAAAGKHLVIEKPAATAPAELDQMQNAVTKSGVKTVVSFVLRWNPLIVMLKKMLADGVFGEPYYVEVDYMSYNGSWWVGWNEARTIEQGISASLVAGCHAVDAARWLATADPNAAAIPKEVYAISGGRRKGTTRELNPTNNTWIENAPPMEYDGLEIILTEFTNGVKAKICVNAECVMPYRFPIRIFGTKGTAIDNKIWSEFFPKQKDWIEIPVVLPDSSDVSHHPFQAEIDHFIDDCVSKNIESHCSLEDAVRSHEIVFAALECYRNRIPVVFPLNHRNISLECSTKK